MTRWLLFGVLLLAGCAPRPTESGPLPVTVLDAPAYHALADGFTPVLDRLGVAVQRAQVYRYDGSQGDGFLRALQRFYRENPGFCPLQEAFYQGPDGVFLTVTARGQEVRGFVYDQRQRPNLTFAFLTGRSAAVLPTPPCRIQAP